MGFNSFNFIVFFALVYVVHLSLSRRYQNYWLLAASYSFYAFWDWRLLGLLLLSTLIGYGAGVQLSAKANVSRRRSILAASVCGQLGILVIFKYFGFFAGGLQSLLGVSEGGTLFQLIVPVGLSFYALQILSYMVDVYRGRIEPSRNLADFALFVAFFPKLLAGPIERASNLLRQVESSRIITSAAVYQGLWLILLGYFQKLVVADSMRLYVDPVFAQPESTVGLKVPVALYAFAFQIYGDFAGYSNIARGVSRLLGFDLMMNFREPYLARNPSDFWSRWHISFSTWMRDYVYIPMGGNRSGTFNTYRNVMLVMVLAGLWHRAAWNFLAWGAFHAVVLIGYRLLQPVLAAIAPQRQFLARLWKLTTLVVFFHLVCFGWLLFAVRKLSDVPLLLTGMFSPFVVNELNGVLTILLLGGPLLWIERSEGAIQEWSRGARLALYAGMFAMIVLSGAVETYEFIYFQF